MSAQGSASQNSNDIIDLVSDDDDDENESPHGQNLHGLYELASLRSLIPPDFFLHTSENDFNFFSKELAVSLINASRTNTSSNENSNLLNSVLPMSNQSVISSITPTSSVSKKSIESKNNNGFNNCKKISSSVSIKPVQASAPVRVQHPNSRLSSVQTTSTTKKSKINNLGGTTVQNGSSGDASHSISSSSLLLSKLTASKALENLKTSDNSVPKSITVNGFTITPTVKKFSDLVQPSESPRKLPPPKYSCEVCHEKFKYNVALHDHLSNIHKISINSVTNESNSSSQNKKTLKSAKKQRRSRKQNSEVKFYSSPKSRKSKTTKVKRKNSKTDDTSNKKALLNSETPPKRPSTEKSTEQSPDAVSEAQNIDECNFAASVIETIKSSPSPPMNCEITDDVSSSDNLVMDVADENACSNTNDDVSNDVFSDTSDQVTDVDEYMKSYKFLTYFEVESNNVKKYRCSTCNKMCIAIELVLDHAEKCIGRKSLVCLFPNCTKSSHAPQQFKEHLKAKHHILTHSCKVCKSFFVKPEDLKLHRLSCVNSENSQYQCPVEGCKVTYFYEMHFRGHLSRRHKIITIFTCKVCKLFFYEEADLNKHYETPAHITANTERLRRLSELKDKLENKAAEKEQSKDDS